jgi:endonuclease YncB( thermonuclease family)
MRLSFIVLIMLFWSTSLAQEAAYLVIKGSFVIVDKKPDGDSVRFRPDNSELFKKLKRGYRIKPSKDGTVQLRFEGIDAPELHYIGHAQPLGLEARDFLLAQLGFEVYTSASNHTITQSTPTEIRGSILSQSAEVNGRPVSYVFLEADLSSYQDGERIELDNTLLAESLNSKVLEAGMAYYTVYSSQGKIQRDFMQTMAQQAKAAHLGIWAVDKTSEFTLDHVEDVTKHQLILPKLFRRCIAYLKEKEKGFSGNIQDWLLANPDSDDEIMLGSRKTRLSSVLQIEGNTVRVLFDPLEAVFIEK